MPDRYLVYITDRALGCLREIFDYIERESPQNAVQPARLRIQPV